MRGIKAMTSKNESERKARNNRDLRARRRETGLVQYRAWVTPAERDQLREYLLKLRGEK